MSDTMAIFIALIGCAWWICATIREAATKITDKLDEHAIDLAKRNLDTDEDEPALYGLFTKER